MKLRHSLAYILAAMILASCATTETVITSPDGTVTRTKTTELSGSDIAVGAAGVAGAVNIVSGDK